MSVQNFTKSLRDKKIPLEERIISASNVLDGSTPLYLPQKPVVILEWVFSALSTEVNARKSSHLWDFLRAAWLECDKDSRSKIVRSYKLPQILLDTWKNETLPIDSIEASLELILDSTLLGCNSDSQAGQIIAGYCKHIRANTNTNTKNLLPALQKQMISRSKIFKSMPKVLDTITLVPNNDQFLADYFSLRDAPVTPTDSKALGEVMHAIVASKTLVTERFTELCNRFPQHVPEILTGLGHTKLTNERETLGLLLEKQISQKNWNAVNLLIDRVPVEVVSQMAELVAGLDNDFHKELATSLLQKASQTRKLGAFIVEWARCKNPGWFSPQFVRDVGDCLEQLSSAQLLELIQSLDGNVLYILSNLTYKSAASTAFKEEIFKFLTLKDAHISFSILSLWPSLPQEHPEIVAQIVALGSLECALLLLERGIDIEYPKTRPSNPGQLVARFYKTLPDLSILSTLSEHDIVQLLEINDIWEYPHVSERLVAHFVENSFDTNKFHAPLQVLPKKLKEGVLTLAWSQLNLRLILELLESSPPRSTECETQPAMLVKLAGKVQEDDAELLMKIAARLCAHQAYGAGLSKLVNVKHWYTQCLAAVVSQDQKLVKTLEKNLTAGKNVTASLACLERLNEAINPAILGQLLNDHKHNSNVFKLLCRSTDDWQSIAAYFIYTGCIHVDTFLEFTRQIDPSNLVVLLRQCIHGKYYRAVEVLFSHKELNKQEIIPFITLMVQTNFTRPQDLNEQQVNEYFELASHLVRENSWVLSQYALETLIMTVAKICTRQFVSPLDQPAQLYTRMCFFIGQTLLFQRHRLNSRNHLIIAALSGLLRCLSGSKLNAEQRLKVGNVPRFVVDHPELCQSTSCAEALLRVVGNFCDPPQRSVRENAGKNNLTSSVGRIRRQVAKTAGVLVGNYATLSLQYGFSKETAPIIQQVIFTLLAVLSAQELKSTIASMDNASRAYMKTVHDSYLALGKWKKD